MKKVFIVTSLLILTVWTTGVKNINSIQNRLIVVPKSVGVEILTTEKVEAEATSTPIMVKFEKQVATTTPKNKVEPAAVSEPIVHIAPLISEPIADFGLINTSARKAVVNILCTVRNNELSPISGTGVIINSKGLVVTNAHIAQYFLLKDLYGKDYITCNLRTGSPAYPKYTVELVYISPTWVKQNIGILKQQNPQGTGENDFAFLRISGMVDGSNLSNIPFIEPNMRESFKVTEPVILVSYPAGFLGSLFILKDLNITSGITNLRDYYTFKSETIDIISVPGTVVSQKGSSGGAVVDKKSTLIGIITTTSSGKTTGERDLAAITLGYINRSLKNETGINLINFLLQDSEAFGNKFLADEAPALTKLIKDNLEISN